MRQGAVTEPSSVEKLFSEWRAVAAQVLTAHTFGARRAALVDCPDYGNVGDSLIGLGQFALFEQCGIDVVHASAIKGFDAEAVRATRPDVILIQGGGNFGDLWPHHQRFREELVRQFPQLPIVQLPQSIHFNDGDAALASAAILSRHGRFHVLCRDDESLRRGQSLGLSVALCPDMALVLRPYPEAAFTDPVVVIRRQDKESLGQEAIEFPTDWYQQDWTDDVAQARRARGAAEIAKRVLPGRAAAAAGVWSFRAAFDARVASGLALVQRGRIVITDRLHVHVLCCLAGRPHAFVDNSYGKVGALWRAWTHRVSFAHPCDSWDAARAWAQAALKG